MSLALFFWALAPSFYAMYISWEGGEVMPPFGWEWLGNVALICCFACFGMGMVFAVIFLVLGIKWIFEKPLADPLLIDLREMKKSLGQMEVDVVRMGKMTKSQDNAEITGEVDTTSQEETNQPRQNDT
jgi:hypothetical protein